MPDLEEHLELWGSPWGLIVWCFMAVITNPHKHGGLQQHRCILIQF